MKQLIYPNLNIEYRGGWCLDAVRRCFGIAAKYGSATTDWTSGNKRIELPPKGFSVPVYFALGNEPLGHVAISLPDGKVASATLPGTNRPMFIHPNLQDIVNVYAKNNGGCTYLGWSDEVNDTKVIDGGTMPDQLDRMTVTRAVEGAYIESTGTVPSKEIINQKVDYIMAAGGFNQVLADIFSLKINYMHQMGAIECYFHGREVGGDEYPGGAPAYARDRWFGGTNMQELMVTDMPPYVKAMKNQGGCPADVVEKAAIIDEIVKKYCK